MTNGERLSPLFVDEIPAELDAGKLYISIQYTTAVHLCACGCGEEVVTTLHPARFSLTYDGETISLHPSVGNSGLACRSHYFVDQNVVRWCTPLDDRGVAAAQARDQRAVEGWDESTQRGRLPEPSGPLRRSWLERLRRFVGRAR